MSHVPSRIALDPLAEPGTAYVWLDAGCPFVDGWPPASDRAVCNFVMATHVAAASLAILAAITHRTPPLDATAQMEQLRSMQRRADFPAAGAPTAPCQSSEKAPCAH